MFDVISALNICFEQKEYSKTYENKVQETKHYFIFKDSQKDVMDHNNLFKAGKVKYEKGINEKSDQVKSIIHYI